ncbi:MAG: TIGR03943 family protein [Mycobacterium sp.]
MSRATQNLVLLLVALSTGVMVVKGTYLHYVKPALLPWLIAAAAVLAALALTAIVRDLREHVAAEDGAHQHHNWMAWLLLIPIALIAFVVPPPLGAQGATPEITATDQPHLRAFPPLPPGDAPTVSLPEVLMRAVTDATKSLAGRVITVTGFTMKTDGGTDIGRVVIICCAADAQLARIHLTGPAAATAAHFPDNTWLQVQGRVDPATANPATHFIPTMAVTNVRQIAKPANTYSY